MDLYEALENFDKMEENRLKDSKWVFFWKAKDCKLISHIHLNPSTQILQDILGS